MARSKKDKLSEKQREEVRKVSRSLVLNRKYQQSLKERLEDGTCHPSVQTMLWNYAFGKPTDDGEPLKAVPVRIINEFAGEDTK